MYSDPATFIQERLVNNYSHIVLWGSLFEKVRDVLKDYTVVHTVFDSFWTEGFDGYEKDVYFLILAKK